MYLKGLAILSALLVVARAVHDATPFGADGDASTPRKAMTVYTTVYATSVATETTTVERICAVQVNVTQVCRRRRDKWIDEPSVLTFDGDLDKVDLMIDPSRTETSVVVLSKNDSFLGFHWSFWVFRFLLLTGSS